jgi:L-2-hydroxyglutarate oxidase
VKHDVIIIGGGIVGLATAFKILQKNPRLNLLVLEKELKLAAHQTGHNSGVIHSGLYYRPGSLKAINCINGYHQLINFCKQEAISYDLCGKIVVATDPKEITLLDTLFSRGLQNGLEGIKILKKEELKEYEPHVEGVAGIYVPQTGIVDYKIVAEKYAEKIIEKGASIILGEKVVQVKTGNTSGSEVITQNNLYNTSLVINCAGLYSDKVAAFTHKDLDLKIIPFRGEYYELKPQKEYLVKNLIYPVPDPNFPFLGVHFTRMIGGGVEAGPNAVLAFQREGYKKRQINIKEFAETLAWPGFQIVAYKYWNAGFGEMYRSFSKAAFTKALQKLIPEIQQDDLIPGEAGVRAQACDKSGGLLDDFLILENPHAINVCNAPSPAATSSLSIGETIANLALKRFDH